MENPTLLLPSTPRFLPEGHSRTASRSPTRARLMDDILADLSPATTLEAFTSASGTLRASIEAASPTQRAFGIRAATASKKIQEWRTELSSWPWPIDNSSGFRIPRAKWEGSSAAIVVGHQTQEENGPGRNGRSLARDQYWGSLPAADVQLYESRIDEISEDMDDLNVEEIKSQVLDRHALPRSRAPSLSGPYVEALSSQPHTRMDDFTAVVTATVLQALPSLSRLISLMDVWSIRLSILRQVSPLIIAMEDAEVALRSGWKAIQTLEPEPDSQIISSKKPSLSRQDYDIMRDVLQDKVSKLGRRLDYMLDTLEGRNDTLPNDWLDRMETIEQDYGEWVVSGERKVRENEWARERSARQQEQLRQSSTALHKLPRADSERGDSAVTTGDDVAVIASPSTAIQTPATAHVGTHSSKDAKSSKPAGSNVVNSPPLPVQQRVSLSNIVKDGPSSLAAQNDVQAAETNESQPIHLTNPIHNNQRVAVVEPQPLESGSSPRFSARNDPSSHREEAVTDLSLLSDGLSEGGNSRREFPRSTAAPQPPETHSKEERVDGNNFEASPPEAVESTTSAVARQTQIGDGSSEDIGMPASYDDSVVSSGNEFSPATFPTASLGTGNLPELSQTTSGSLKVLRFGNSVSNSLRKEPSSEVLASPSRSQNIDSNMSLQKSVAETTALFPEPPTAVMQQSPQSQEVEDVRAQHQIPAPATPPRLVKNRIPDPLKLAQASPPRSKPSHIELPNLPLNNSSEKKGADYLSPPINSRGSAKGHNRGPSSASAISGYATSEPSPELHEAEPTEYFRPVSPPIISKLPDLSIITTPTRISFSNASVSGKTPETSPTSGMEEIDSPRSLMSRRIMFDLHKQDKAIQQKASSEFSGTPTRRRPVSNESVISVIRTALGQGRSSQEGSISSEQSTINERLNSVSSTPVRLESPSVETVPRSWHSQFVSNYDGESPALERTKIPGDRNNYDTASSPPPDYPSGGRPLQLRKTPSFDPDSFYPDSPATPGSPPALKNVELSPTPAFSTTAKHSDDQLQQQISEILESIPARIRLTTESDTASASDIKPVKKRISLNPFSRPASRAATPSFTLAPAHARNPRPRPQNGQPEIKLYHLSRSTGEAPIKLFVRLVGERGERVMVRVGGGWADLGEYLKEYASHHGRRSEQPGRVEIQDLPPRVVSTGSTASTSTLRNGTWNTSEASSPVSRPGSRPGSAFGRPLSSLAIRKTRKSVGEEAREKGYRSPSTPLPPSFRSSPSSGPRQIDTPTSANSGRSVSQMSWREDESTSLGLAGPRSRKGEISAENAAWVESMKQKVRVASAEKEKKDKATFGDMGQVGATKRLFKRSS